MYSKTPVFSYLIGYFQEDGKGTDVISSLVKMQVRDRISVSPANIPPHVLLRQYEDAPTSILFLPPQALAALEEQTISETRFSEALSRPTP